MSEEEEARRRRNKQLLEVSTLGFLFPASIGVGYLCGWGLDRWLGTHPWMTAIFTGFGVIAAFVNLFRMSSGGDDSGGKPAGNGS